MVQEGGGGGALEPPGARGKGGAVLKVGLFGQGPGFWPFLGKKIKTKFSSKGGHMMTPVLVPKMPFSCCFFVVGPVGPVHAMGWPGNRVTGEPQPRGRGGFEKKRGGLYRPLSLLEQVSPSFFLAAFRTPWKGLWISIPSSVQVLLAFSAVKNTRDLFDHKPLPTNFLNGVRYLSIMWIVLGHVALFSKPGWSNAASNIDAILDNYAMVFIFGAFFAVDTFFFMSGFLQVRLAQWAWQRDILRSSSWCPMCCRVRAHGHPVNPGAAQDGWVLDFARPSTPSRQLRLSFV